jgi:ribulose-phosphate 3-epimerase
MLICPTITANNTHQYREQIERVTGFAKTIHIDVMDGRFTQTLSPGVSQVWWPENIKAHLHLMVEMPEEVIEQAIKFRPELVIVHAEADMSQVTEVLRTLKREKIRAGLALLPETDPEDDDIYGMLSLADHALVFGGKLGHHGGSADLKQLDKVKKIRKLFPDIEIGWDGGVNVNNAKQIADTGVNVINVGSYIQHAETPEQNYQRLLSIIKG